MFYYWLKKEFDISSVYLSAQAPACKAQIHTITKCKIINDQAITGGDFNCVESTDLDVRHPVEWGGMPYANASGISLARRVADNGMIDAYRLVHGETKDGYSRLAHTVHIRIDRIYTQAYDSEWRWQSITAPPTLFTGKAKSDHLPVVAKIALAKERPPSEGEAKINSAIFDNPNIRYITSLIWKKQIEKYPQEMHGHAKGWEAAKSAVATYLHYKTNELRRRSSPISSLKAKIRITHAALEKNGPSPILTAKITAKINTVHNEIEQARATFSHRTQIAPKNTAKEEPPYKRIFFYLQIQNKQRRHSRNLQNGILGLAPTR
jgi:hypothetical protein